MVTPIPQNPFENIENYPNRSPINTPVIPYHSAILASTSLAGHVLISGDHGTGRSARAKIIAEDAMADGYQVVTISYSPEYGRLGLNLKGKPNGKRIFTINRNTSGLNFIPEHGTAIGRHVATTSDSFAIDISGFSPDGVAEFLQGFFSQIPIGNRKKLCIIMDDLDSGIARRRNGVDSQALKDFYATLTRGLDMGISVVMVTRSPSEIPIEIRNAISTLIVHRTGFDPHIAALTPVFDKGLDQFKNVEAFGIRFIPNGHSWIRPIAEVLPDTPFFYPLRDFTTGVGDKSGYDDQGGDDLSAIVAAIRKNTKKKKGKKFGKAPKGSRTKKTVVKGKSTNSRGEKSQAAKQLRLEGATYYTQRVVISAILIDYRNPGATLDQQLLLETARHADIGVSAAWGAMNGKSLFMTPCLAASLHRIVHDLNPDVAQDFLDGIQGKIDLDSQDARHVLRQRLENDNKLKKGDIGRLGLALYAWNKFVADEKVKHLRTPDQLPQANAPQKGEVVAMPKAIRAKRLAA